MLVFRTGKEGSVGAAWHGGGQAVYLVRIRNAKHGFVADKKFEGV